MNGHHYEVELELKSDSHQLSAGLRGGASKGSKVWSVYLSEADRQDKALAENWKGDTEGILIFVCPSFRPPLDRSPSRHSPRPKDRSFRRYSSSVHHRELQAPVRRYRLCDRPLTEPDFATALRAIRRGADTSPTALQRLFLSSDLIIHPRQHPLVSQPHPEPDMRPCRDLDAAVGTPVPAACAVTNHVAQARSHA